MQARQMTSLWDLYRRIHLPLLLVTAATVLAYLLGLPAILLGLAGGTVLACWGVVKRDSDG